MTTETQRKFDEAREGERLRVCHDELLAACKDLFAMMDEGWLVRDTANDSEPGWAVKQLHFVQRLAKAQAAIAKAEVNSQKGARAYV